MASDKNKTYLGDGAYAEFGDQHIKLTAENGERATDTIFLEDNVLAAFLRALSTHYDKDRLIALINGDYP